jgi:hypothetical protein
MRWPGLDLGQVFVREEAGALLSGTEHRTYTPSETPGAINYLLSGSTGRGGI